MIATIAKVGGSLLDWPELPERLARYLGAAGGASTVLIAGGGPWVEELRGLDRVHRLGEERAHGLAVGLLNLTAELLAMVLPRAVRVEGPEACRDVLRRGGAPVLAPGAFLEADDRSDQPLPHSWRVTSDSIAARVAVRLGADHLVLIKSTDLPAGFDRAEAARRGLVDPFFPIAAARLPRVDWVNLRGDANLVELVG